MMEIPEINDNFSEAIIDRGYKYYKQGKVKDLILDDDKARAVVSGTRNYRIMINLKTSYFRCSCPYYGNCKHEVAVLYMLKYNKDIEPINDVLTKLNNKPKKYIITILHKMISAEPKLIRLISDKSIVKSIETL